MDLKQNQKVIITLVALGFVGSLLFIYLLAQVQREIEQPVALADVPYAQSEQCVMCHPSYYQTWHQTFHRTMTQEPSPQAIVGDFADAAYTYQGVPSRFTMENGRYYIETRAFDQPEKYEVAMAIGSRRIQQYVTQIGDRHYRLPLAWSIENGRWIHLNGGFLDPDGTKFTQHTSLWDGNCIFCHNVKAQPGYDVQLQTFDAQVAELGIACEACHGPATEHIERNKNPLRRYLLYVGDRDPSLISPNELEPLRQVQLCGHCHGQRMPNPVERIEQFMTVGDPFTAGEDLNEYTTPLFADGELPGVDLSKRFWQDGSPRLSAYEYQGYLLSDEHHESDLTCTSCHSAHGGDPKGMIEPIMRGQTGCVQCHGEIGENVEAHTQHPPNSSGSDCYACHMPDTVYGLLNIHPTHHIENPNPAKAWQYEMPEACTLCHTNETAVWAAQTVSEQWQQPAPEDLPTDNAFTTAEAIRTLLMGDVVQSAVAIDALSEGRDYLADPQARLWTTPFLLLAMEDNYPAIRYMAWRGLNANLKDANLSLDQISFDYLADEADRQLVMNQLWHWWADLDKQMIPHPGTAVPLNPDLSLNMEIVEPLLAQRSNELIHIGE